MLEVILNLQLTGISHQGSLVLEVRGQVSNAFCTFLSLSLSLSLTHTHTHTQSDLPPFIVLQRRKRNSEPQTQSWQQGWGESRPSLHRSWHSSWCNNEPASFAPGLSASSAPQPLLGRLFHTYRRAEKLALFLKLQELPSTEDQEVPRGELGRSLILNQVGQLPLWKWQLSRSWWSQWWTVLERIF